MLVFIVSLGCSWNVDTRQQPQQCSPSDCHSLLDLMDLPPNSDVTMAKDLYKARSGPISSQLRFIF